MKDNLNKILNIFIALAVIFVFVVIAFKLIKFDSGLEKYKKGIELYNEKDYQNAYYNFSRIPKQSKYYEIALFRQGMCAERLGDNETQSDKYEEYAKKIDNILTPEAAFKSGIAFFNAGKYGNAQKMFKRAIKTDKVQEGNTPSNYAIASNYFLAEIEKDKNPKNSLSYYLKYIEQISDGRYSYKSAKNIIEHLNNNQQIQLSEKQNLYVASALYYAGDYETAKTFFDKISYQTDWFLKAQNYIKLKQNSQALDVLQAGLVNYYKNTEEKDLSAAINYFAKLYSIDDKEGWRILEDMFSQTDFPLLDEIYYNLGKYDLIYSKNLKGKYASKALYKQFFDAYDKKDYNSAKNYAISYIERFPNDALTAKVLYYLGCIYEKNHRSTEAIQAYNRLRVNYPDTFWAFRAYIKTNQDKSLWAKWSDLQYCKLDVSAKIPQFPYSEVVLTKEDALLLNNLIKVEDYELIEKIAPNNLALKSWTNYKSGNYSLSVVNARDYLNSLTDKPDFQNDLYVLAYPIMYKDEINKYVQLYNLNAFLMEALIREESYFNSKAKSPVGALGLMQLMPSTASFINQTEVSQSMLFEPDYNISAGTKYYKYVKDTLHNNNIYAVLAYNGGPGAVQNWINKNDGIQTDEFLENIPFDETQNYIFKVYKTYWNYLNVYKADKL